MSLTSLPVLSLTMPKAEFAQAIGESFRTFGFAMVKDFAIDRDLIDRAWKLSEAFFALPEEEKRRYHDPEIGGARAAFVASPGQRIEVGASDNHAAAIEKK